MLTLKNRAKRKYKNKPVEYNGIRFDSKAEAYRYFELKTLEKAGEIRLLYSGRECGKYKLTARNGAVVTTYRPDFEYIDKKTGVTVVEDVKSSATITDLFKIKKKLMLDNYNIDVKVVMSKDVNKTLMPL